MTCTFGRKSRRWPQGAVFLVEGTVWTKACKSAFMESSSAQDGWSVGEG